MPGSGIVVTSGSVCPAIPRELIETPKSGRSKSDICACETSTPGSNALKLLPAFELYEPPAYLRLVTEFGIDKIFILSAGWGLIPAAFLTPAYDITFSQAADDYKRRHKSNVFRDFIQFPVDSDEPLVFLGGKNYLPLFAALTEGAKGRRVIFYNSTNLPEAPGCTLQRYVTTTRTNWHYECVQALVDGRFGLSG